MTNIFLLSSLSIFITNHFNDTKIHKMSWLLQTSLKGGTEDFIKEMSHYGLVLYKPPEEQLEIVTVNLHLLQSKPCKGFQSDTLQQSLQSQFDNSS